MNIFGNVSQPLCKIVMSLFHGIYFYFFGTKKLVFRNENFYGFEIDK